VEQAVNAVKVEGLSLRKASERFNVPKSKIMDHLADRRQLIWIFQALVGTMLALVAARGTGLLALQGDPFL
jgi:hypothetical protein